MNVPSNIMKLRLERAAELTRYAQLIDKYSLSANTYLLHDAARKLRDKTHAFHKPKTTNYSCWGYNIEGLIISVPFSGRHILPHSIKSLEISVDTKILCDYEIWRSYSDPFLKMNFRAMVRGTDTSGTYSFGFHIDKHEEERLTEEIHPIYHLQYSPKTDDELSKLGNVLYMDAPRMMHAPVDIILGIDLILSNFAPNIWNKMRDEAEYHSIFKLYQESFWRPYIHTLASNWDFNHTHLSWNGKHLICPNLCE